MTATDQSVPAVAKPAYVGGLDGLRAMAVAAVIVYHFAPTALPAGFLGVDVFFVVSGFLIARLLVAEVAASGAVSLRNFWARRARRLLPALATMSVAVLVAVAISFTDTELHDIRAQAIGTLFYCANWVMIVAKGSYFTSVGRPSPFLHMWSLAVEEQFYLVMPIVCFLARRSIARRPVRAAVIALVGAVASSVWMAALVAPHGDPSRAYLGSDSHAMGLFVGVALGVLAGAGRPWDAMASRLRSSPATARCSAVVGAGALLAILVTMFLADDHTEALYRGGFLAFAVACGVLIVVVVTMPKTTVSEMLGAPWLVAIGLRSYSLYLWHWPVRVFVTPRPGFDGVSLFAVRTVVSVVLAEISFRAVERPFRVGTVARRSGTRGTIVLFAALTLVAFVLVGTVAAPAALPPNSLDQAGRIPGNRATTTGPGTVPETRSSTPSAPARVDVFGDSTGLVFGLSGAEHSRELGITVGGDARLGCGVVQTDHLSAGRAIPNPTDCEGWQARWNTVLRNDPTAALAIVTGAWDILDHRTSAGVVKFGTRAWTDVVTGSLRDALRVLTATGRTVHVFQVPCYGAGNPNDPLPERADPLRIAALNDIYEQVATEVPHVEIVRWRTLVCPDGRRIEAIRGVQLWKPDDVHLTDAGGVLVWKWWLPQLRAS